MSVRSKVAENLKQLLDRARDEKTRQRVKDEIRRANLALDQLKKEALKRERKALAYAKKNPEKALALAVAFGAAAGALLTVLRKRARA